jgi:hypothetical protein
MSTQTSFPIFEDNQVLTSSQLNEMRKFLDDDNHLTRTKLIGIGVGYGFHVSFGSSTNEIFISCGTGTTSEGYLATLGDCATNRYRDYQLPVGSPYPPFIGAGGNQDVTLYELLTTGSTPDVSDVFLSTELSANPNFLDDKACLLYVELADVDNASCLGRKCDEFGVERTFTLRKLMVSFSDLDLIIARSSGSLADPLFPAKFGLSDVTMRRALFVSATPPSQNYLDFSLNFANTFRNDIFGNILTQLQQTYVVYESLLSDSYNNSNPFLDATMITNINTWTNYLNGSSTGPAYFGMQYFYDFVKDLILAYDEFCEVAFEIASECCINMTRFPRHLMIGEVLPTGICGPSKYRQEFIYSRLMENQKLLVDKAIMLHERIVLQMLSFDFALINNPSQNVLTRITPSFEKKSELSERSVPYYYRLNTNFPFTSAINSDQGMLSKHWRYDLIRKCKTVSGVTQVVSYGNQDVNQFVDNGPVRTPLYYNLDEFNFYRIEGHFRKPYTTVVADLENKKSQFDLPFNVVALRLQGQPFDVVEDRCNFEDLRLQYGTLRSQFLCRLDDLCGRVGLELNPNNFLKRLYSDANSVTGNTSVVFNPPGTISGTGTVGVAEGDPGEIRSAERGDGSGVDPVGGGRTSGTGEVPAGIRFGTDIASKDTPLDILINDYNRNITDFCAKLDAVGTLLPYDFKTFNYGATITRIDQSFIKSYIDAVTLAISSKIAFSRLLDWIVRNVKTRFTEELYFELTQYTTEVLAMFNDFIQDCTYREFEFIYYTYLYRVNYLRTHDPLLFSNFIKKHPGVEHQAGVKPGGTFIVVYPGNNITVNVQSISEVLLVEANINALVCEQQVLINTPVLTDEQTARLAFIDNSLNECFAVSYNLGAGTPVSISLPAISVEEHQVIADFALPYLCCCDCDCDDIPPPTSVDLALPNVNVPLFVEYNMGDYCFGRPITSSMEGCTDLITPLIINLKNDKVQYDSTLGSTFVLKFIQNGQVRVPRVNPLVDSIFIDSIITPGGGTASIILENRTDGQVFSYTPLKGFVGVDTFEYIFEVYNPHGVKVQSSTPGRVVINVVSSCGLVAVGQNPPTSVQFS